MKRFILHIFAALTLLAASTANAQTNTLPVRTVDGQQYHYYEVKEKETIYSISRQLGIDRAYIERYIPSVADGLRAGQVLYFPVTAGKGASSLLPETIHLLPLFIRTPVLFYCGPQLYITAAGLAGTGLQIITFLTGGKPALVELPRRFQLLVHQFNVPVELP